MGRDVGLGDEHPRRPDDLPGHLQHHAARLTEAYTLFPERRRAPARRISSSASTTPTATTIYRAAARRTSRCSSRARRGSPTPSCEKVMQKGTAAEAALARFQEARRGQDRHDERFPRRVVRRLHDEPDVRRVGGLGPRRDDHGQGLRRGAGAADLVPGDEQGVGATLPGQGVPAARSRCKRVRVCAFSNELATDGCEAAGTAYAIDLPASRVPG